MEYHRSTYPLILSIFILLISTVCCLSSIKLPNPVGPINPTLIATLNSNPSPGEIPTLTSAAPVNPAPTVTPYPPASLTPVVGFSSIQMIDEMNGWAWAYPTHDTPTLLRTSDGGQTWMDVSPANMPGISAGFFLDADTAWIQTYDSTNNVSGLAFTSDGGANWTVVNSNINFYNASFHFNNATDGWAESAEGGAGQAAITYYTTQDGGATWDQVMLINPEQDNGDGILFVCNICSDNVYYDQVRVIIVSGDMANDPAGTIRLSISKDLGKTWKQITLAMPSTQYVKDGLVDPAEPVFFNGGKGLLPFSIIAFAQGGGETYRVFSIYSTQDGGLTWKTNPTVLENVDKLDPVDILSPVDAFVACGKDLCVTHDAAKTWQTVTSNLDFNTSDETESVWRIDFVNPTTGWAVTSAGDARNLWKTTDGGQSWTKLSLGLLP